MVILVFSHVTSLFGVFWASQVPLVCNLYSCLHQFLSILLFPISPIPIEREAVAWAVEAVSAARIDEINILNASFEGMSLAVARLDPAPSFLAIDGNRFRTRLEIPYRCIVKGDGKYADIAAASVLAKTHRDEYMLRIAEEFPQYGWTKNKGYPTREHRLAIREYGLTPHHRLTFNHEIDQLELPF